MEKIFVYGTLKEGYGNHRLLTRSKKLGNYTVPSDSLCLVDLGPFPAVVHKEVFGISTPITGEVYEVDDETFQSVDWLEGYPSFYNRTEIETDYGTAWVYYLPKTRAKYVAICKNGVWPR